MSEREREYQSLQRLGPISFLEIWIYNYCCGYYCDEIREMKWEIMIQLLQREKTKTKLKKKKQMEPPPLSKLENSVLSLSLSCECSRLFATDSLENNNRECLHETAALLVFGRIGLDFDWVRMSPNYIRRPILFLFFMRLKAEAHSVFILFAGLQVFLW